MHDAALAGRRDLVKSTPGNRALANVADRQARPVVVVLGLRHGGMSLAAHILSVLGIDMADPIDPQSAGPSPRWERVELARYHDRILDLFDRGHGTPRHDLQLPVAWWADPRVRQVQREIATALEQRMPARTVFGFMDPRTARLLPIWHQIFRELELAPKIILCLRNPAAIAQSIHEQGELDYEIGEYRWFTCMIDIFRNLRDYDTCTIEFEDWFPDWVGNLEKLMGFLGIEWDQMQADLDTAVSHIVGQWAAKIGRHPVEVRQPLVRSFYSLTRRFADEPAARDKIGYIVNQFVAYRQLNRPFEREFEQALQRSAAAEDARLQQDLDRTGAEVGDRQAGVEAVHAELGAVHAEFAACEVALAEATGRAETIAARLAEVEAERDLALARVERTVAERETALEAARAELISVRAELALRRTAGARVAAQAEDVNGSAELTHVRRRLAEQAAEIERLQRELANRIAPAGAQIASRQDPSSEPSPKVRGARPSAGLGQLPVSRVGSSEAIGFIGGQRD